eukprot:8979512-Pyramimonas_sp.AAC.1
MRSKRVRRRKNWPTPSVKRKFSTTSALGLPDACDGPRGSQSHPQTVQEASKRVPDIPLEGPKTG